MGNQQNAHFFFALKLPSETKKKLNEHCEELKGKFPFSRWVHHDDYHITLAFLGSAPEDKLIAAAKLVADSIKNVKSFPLFINRLGVFGNESAPRIFWSDTEREERLHYLRDQVFSACKEAGFKLEKRPFKPHITIARKWIGSENFQKSMLDQYNPFKEKTIEFSASGVVLYRTHLDKTPKYESIAIFPLLVE
ncbi:RNA 2',3'-cyclic phosphodiesterase [Cytobacillus sp. NCCP-133]|uniref:RNA 2',3'-cyclic phosphodiesterase n=1 Tax=Cytobacillus sp. NCCP-133 TaxID=766848 RepID=UPI002232732A|nr:RNA 2',3'-cyclic phosphodiesterase [Cytobacillus sp. NCCP-133]GLB58563.1 RNA 2',3'-cyclic phosphodiesterase [Cytobacillus sp. NCCP-133]